MSKILFLDIDGVVLPLRAYMLPNQTSYPYPTLFDPCAVSMINRVCHKQERQIVVHSSWVKYCDKGWLESHLTKQGIDETLLHEDWFTDPNFHWRYDRVRDWLSRHKETADWVVVDDEAPSNAGDKKLVKGHFVHTNFDEGITMHNYRQLLDGEFGE